MFDFNDPIITNEVVYAIDAAPPSQRRRRAARHDAIRYTFPVTWSGSDAGAGIAAYDVYVSDNGGPFQPWLAATPQTTADYTGLAGHTYAFYSVATDTRRPPRGRSGDRRRADHRRSSPTPGTTPSSRATWTATLASSRRMC